MKKGLIIFATLFLSLINLHATNIETVSLEQVNDAITQKQPDVTIVDVRKASDFAQGHIPNAINIPFDKYGKFEKFDEKNAQYPGLSKNGVNYVYCYNEKCTLSAKACKAFLANKYQAKEIKGGYTSWKAKNYPIELAKEK